MYLCLTHSLLKFAVAPVPFPTSLAVAASSARRRSPPPRRHPTSGRQPQGASQAGVQRKIHGLQQVAVVVQNRVTLKWLALATVPWWFVLTHTHILPVHSKLPFACSPPGETKAHSSGSTRCHCESSKGKTTSSTQHMEVAMGIEHQIRCSPVFFRTKCVKCISCLARPLRRMWLKQPL